MGLYPAPNHCFITGLATKDRPSEIDEIDYFIVLLGKNYHFKFESHFEPSVLVKKNKNIIIGMLLNDKFDNSKVLNNKILERTIIEADIPKSPKEKLEYILQHINQKSEYDGADFKITSQEIRDELLYYKVYLKNENELNFYLSTLQKRGLIGLYYNGTKSDYFYSELHITYEGLNYLINLEEKKSKKNRCFIAMSFSKEMKPIRQSIKNACINTGFVPVLIDEVHLESEITINDAIIKEIKNCNFCIADFTQQKDGVYFEAGFALGYGRKVIYCCRKDWFENSHFDTNHFPHIIYETNDELQTAIENKVNAWIK